MAGYIIPIGTGREENWTLARDNKIWALVKNYRIREGDDLFFWQAGHGLIAHARASTDSTPVTDFDSLPWPDHAEMKYAWKFYLDLLHEPTSAVETRWSEIRNLLGNKDIPNKPALRIENNRVDSFIRLFTDSSQPTPGHSPKLSDITDPASVNAAIQEFSDRGRNEFLAKYGLEPSRDYFINLDGRLVDSKPILSVAHAYQFPKLGTLPVSAFSGGSGGAVRALTRLGFATTTRAQVQPPRLGDTYLNRTAIYESFGGDKVAGIIRFPGDAIVNIFSDADGPYSDDPPSLLEPFGYRGEGLNGPQHLKQGGNALLEGAREERVPVRFWYRPQGGKFSFLAFALVLGRAWIDGTGSDGVARPEIDWQVAAIPGENGQIPPALDELLDESEAATEDNPITPEAKPDPTYLELLIRVEALGNAKRPSGVVRTNYFRSAAARRAVLLRSNGRCESERCTGMPAELNRQGVPILDIDHIKDLGKGGEDHPLNMVALCPNCHACKTRGANSRRWRSELAKAAVGAHERAICGTDQINLDETGGERILQSPRL